MGIDRSESKLGRIMLWVMIAFFGVMVAILFATPEPMEEKLPIIPYLVGVFGLFAGFFWWMSRKRLRLYGTTVAKLLLDAPGTIKRVRVEIVEPRVGGVARGWVSLDGEREFVPVPEQVVRVFGVPLHPRTWVYMEVEGKLVSRKLVVPRHMGAEVLSWLFATLAAANPECGWGKDTTIADLTTGR